MSVSRRFQGWLPLFLMGALIVALGAFTATKEDAFLTTFNLNILRVLNTRFDADFDIEGFRHHAFYDDRRHRIEMHLVSIRPQSVHIPGAGDFQLREGESIRTEISCKYDRNSVAQLFASAGLEMEAWVTDDDALFALALGAAQDDSGSPVTRNP